MRSAVILAGGEARRAKGREKYFFTCEGKTFIERLVGTLADVTEDIVIVARSPEQCIRFKDLGGIACTSDIRQGLGPIGGLHAGTLAVKGDEIFVCACDMPFVNPAVIGYLFGALGSYDAAIPKWNEWMFEPLHAVYRRQALLSYLESHTSLSLRSMVQSLNTRYIPVDDLRRFDPDLKTFTNINQLDELDRINRFPAPGH